MNKTVWLKDGVSTFPVQQPMVGQKEFYDAFKAYVKDLKDALTNFKLVHIRNNITGAALNFINNYLSSH